jgi:hypothetical protein
VWFCLVTGCARIGNTRLLRLCPRNEPEGMCADEVAFDRPLNTQHMAGNALTSFASLGVVRILAPRSGQT